MRNRLFRGVFSALLLSSPACATSAIELEDGGEPVDEGDEELDAGDIDDPVEAERDSGVRDARVSQTSDGAVADAGKLLDAGESGSKDAAVPNKDAAVPVDASRPDAGPPPLTCNNGTTACTGQCVNLTTDGSNCGMCGKSCSATQTCTNSQCVDEMQPSQVPNGCTAQTYQSKTYAFCTQTRKWDDARKSCLGAKMDLVLIGDKAESDFVKGNGESWTGLTDLDKEGSFVYVVAGDGQRTNGPAGSYFNWKNGEPNNQQRCDGIDIFVGCLGAKTDEDCAVISNDGSWNDDLCTRSKRYVCEAY